METELSKADMTSFAIVEALSRRDKRTEPGVLTPGIVKRMIRPEGGGGTRICAAKCRTRLETNYLPPFQGGFMGWIYPWG